MTTIVVDTSALVAVVFGESDSGAYVSALLRSAAEIAIGAPTLLETSIVVEGRAGRAGGDNLRALLDALGPEIVPCDAEQASIAAAAWRRFGKGRHPASLNFGDCFSYALAKHLGASLLFKGDDFAQTDVSAVL